MAYAIGTKVSAADDPSSSAVLNVSVTYAAHDHAFIGLTYGSGTTISETLSDGTNTYALVPTNGHVNIGVDSQSYALYECLDCAAGSFTLGFTPGSAVPYRGIWVIPVSGLSNSIAAVVASQNQGGPGTGALAVTSPSLTPGSQPGMLLAVTVDDNGTASSISANTGGGFTDDGVVTNWDSVIGVISRIEDKRLTSTAAVAAAFTANGSGGGNFATFAIFVPESSGGGGGGGLPFFMQSDLKSGYISSKSGGFN